MDSPNKLQKYKSTKSTKKYISTKVLITQSFLELQTQILHGSSFAPSNQEQKHKNTKVQKVQTGQKMEKNVKT